MCVTFDLMFLKELCGEGPGSVTHHLVNITAVPQGVVAFILCHHCIALKLVGEFITADWTERTWYIYFFVPRLGFMFSSWTHWLLFECVFKCRLSYLLQSGMCWGTNFWPASALVRAPSGKGQRSHQRKLAPDDELQNKEKKYQHSSRITSQSFTLFV